MSKTRFVRAKLYAAPQRHLDKKGDFYTKFAICCVETDQLYRLRAFGGCHDRIQKELRSREEVYTYELELDTKQDDDVKTGKCLAFRKDETEEQQRKRMARKRSGMLSPEEWQEELKRQFEKGIVWARTIHDQCDWTAKGQAVRAFKQWWKEIDFCVLMLGSAKVSELMKEAGFEKIGEGASRPDEWKQFKHNLKVLAFSDYKAGIYPREAGIKFHGARDPDSVLPGVHSSQEADGREIQPDSGQS